MSPTFQSNLNHIAWSGLVLAVVCGFWFNNKTSTTNDNSSAQTFFNLIASTSFALVAALILVTELVYITRRLHIPAGDSGWPLLGHLPHLMSDPLGTFRKMARKYGTPFTMNFLMNPCVIFVEDEDAGWIQAQERKGHVIPFFAPHVTSLLGPEAMIFANGSHHRRLRKMVEPAFSPKGITSYVSIIDGIVQEELKVMSSSSSDDDCYSSLDQISALAMKLFFACTLGNVHNKLLSEMHHLYKVWIQGFYSTAIPIHYPGSPISKAYHAKQELRQVTQDLMNDFRKLNLPGSETACGTILGRLCYETDSDTGKTLSDEEIITNIMLLVFAGHDNTKSTFGNIFYFLSENPSVAQAVAKEVQTFSNPLDTTKLSRGNAPILNAFLAETWRLIAPVAFHPTKVVVDGGLDYKGYHIPKGASTAFTMQLQNFTNTERFPDPDEFQLERWIPKGATQHDELYDEKYYVGDDMDYNIMSTKYRTFGGGPHMCIGSYFAKLEARILLTRLMQKYSVNVRNAEVVPFPLMQMKCEFQLTPIH